MHADPEAVGDLVDANHILARRGLLDGFGHISARDGDRLLIARNIAPARVATTDVVRVAFDGTVSAGDARKPYLERFIRGAIYAARPDVGAIVHSHAASVIPFSLARGASLCAVSHMGGFLGAGVPLFEIRDAPAVLMRGHGITVVGADVRQAVFRAIYTDVNARLQSEALRLGPLVPLNAHEARRASEANDSQIERAWELWKSER